MRNDYLKPKLTIERIGFLRFWFGIYFGFMFSIFFLLIVNYIRETFRYISSSFDHDLVYFSNEQFLIFDLLHAFIVVAISFGLTQIIWFYGLKDFIRNRKYRHRFLLTHSMFVVFVVLMLFFRMSSLFSFYNSFLSHFSFHFGNKNIIYYFFLAPIYIYLLQWHVLSRFYKVGYWNLIAASVLLGLGLFLGLNNRIDRDIVNNNYYKTNIERFSYIENEIEELNDIGIIYNDTIIRFLEYKYYSQTFEMMLEIKERLDRLEKVRIDSLKFEKIFIHNMNDRTYLGRNIESWHYIYPENIYKQIKQYNPSDKEVDEFINIFNEMVRIFNSVDDGYENLTNFERSRKFYSQWLIRSKTKTIYSRLEQVYFKLLEDTTLVKYHSNILKPEIDIENYKNQTVFEIIFSDEN